MKLKLITSICLLPLCLAAQTTTTPVPAAAKGGPPIYVLYRLFFRDIAAMDAAAAKSDAAGQPGGTLARGWYQSILLLTAADAATLKQSASQCNQALDQLQQTAQPAIAAVQAQLTVLSPTAAPPPQLVALEQQHTAVSNTCIQNLHSALSDKKFTDIDVFVRTKFAQKVSSVPPPNAPFANVPIVRAGGGN